MSTTLYKYLQVTELGQGPGPWPHLFLFQNCSLYDILSHVTRS